jgi:hypothetical protein
MDGGDRQSLGGGVWRLASYRVFWLTQPLGRCTRGRQPVHAHRLVGLGHASVNEDHERRPGEVQQFE